ncbi:MAG: FliI/YscN family ATPase [Deltaproteobacteria bacterium]|nr:FliI/YscN family ATPase [Deltaproteobacteria bacterium]
MTQKPKAPELPTEPPKKGAAPQGGPKPPLAAKLSPHAPAGKPPIPSADPDSHFYPPHLEYLKGYQQTISETATLRHQGKITQMIGGVIEAYNPGTSVGHVCVIYNPDTGKRGFGEVVGFRDDKILLMSLGEMPDISPRCLVIPDDRPPRVRVGDSLLGRVLNGLGRPIDDKGEIVTPFEVPLYTEPLNPLRRKRISKALDVGVRAINGLLTCGQGQRIGIMAGSGVGKSVLLGMMARHTTADVNVIALVGERGREVLEFIERDLGETGMSRTVVVVATSDQPPLIRTRAAYVATSIAEFFRDQGQNVLFMMDSVTRFAMAQREIGLAAGEPPTTKGYPPSVFNQLPRLLERCGMSDGQGSMTGFYTVLVEGDDPNEPIADAVRSIVDGHILLSRDLAAGGQYPAIDLLHSTSRVMTDVVNKSHKRDAQRFISTLATYREAEDLINIGAYIRGSNQRIDYSLNKIDAIIDYIKQQVEEPAPLAQCEAFLERLFSDFEQPQKH